ncbi:hypothetical protein BH23ACT3_BH23ACT3_10780 [soil metagenome]
MNEASGTCAAVPTHDVAIRGPRRWAAAVCVFALMAAACSGDDDAAPATTVAPATTPETSEDAPSETTEDALPETTDAPATPPPTTAVDAPDEAPGPTLMAGAASRSVLPTVDGERDFLSDAPGWPAADELDPFDPGVFVASFDQGRVDVGNGRSDGSWVRDDLRAVAVALELGEQRVVLVSTDTYLHFAVDAAEMIERSLAALPADWADAEILVSATHNHHGPDTGFDVNDDWYSLLADETAAAVADAVAALEPAEASVATGTHTFGVNDVRDPVVLDPRLNVLVIDGVESRQPIATLVQWNSHPETTLGWTPPAEAAGLDEACPIKGWEDDACSANGRYFTADFPGVLRTRIADHHGGEVMFFNGAVGNQIGPGGAPVWNVTDEHPVGDGWNPPDGAEPLTECDDRDTYLCRDFAKTEAIGTQLALAVIDLFDEMAPTEITELTVSSESFFTRLTNIGFRVLIAEGDIGWQEAILHRCEGEPAADTCVESVGELTDDPVLTPLIDSQIAAGNAVQSRIAHLSLGDVGFLFMPGELPPELVVGLPADFHEQPEKYYREPELHAVGADYDFPGYLLSLVDESVTFTVGLGIDQLGYWVPIADYRLRCLDITLSDGASCESLADRGVIESPEWISGRTCATITDDPAALDDYGDDAAAVASICRYGQALGRELGEPDGHYEETNAAGWDVVDNLWAAATRLFGRDGTGPVNPDNVGLSPINPG